MILITGGKGQLGTLLKKELINYHNPESIILAVKSEFECSLNCKVEIGDLQDIKFLRDIFSKHKISHVFNFATKSFVERNLISKDFLDYGRCKIFDNLVQVVSEHDKNIWLFHPLSSEIFGVPENTQQGNLTKISPINSYGIQKAYELIKSRFLNSQGFNIFHPILFNIESSYRSEKFFTGRIIRGILNYKSSSVNAIRFYNAFSRRDFSYGPDIVKLFCNAMKLGIKGDECIGSSFSLTIIDFIKLTLKRNNIPFEIFNEHNLIKIKDLKGKTIAYEAERDLMDLNRKFRFDGKYNNPHFNSNKIRGGEDLIDLLVSDYDNLRKTKL